MTRAVLSSSDKRRYGLKNLKYSLTPYRKKFADSWYRETKMNEIHLRINMSTLTNDDENQVTKNTYSIIPLIYQILKICKTKMKLLINAHKNFK